MTAIMRPSQPSLSRRHNNRIGHRTEIRRECPVIKQETEKLDYILSAFREAVNKPPRTISKNHGTNSSKRRRRSQDDEGKAYTYDQHFTTEDVQKQPHHDELDDAFEDGRLQASLLGPQHQANTRQEKRKRSEDDNDDDDKEGLPFPAKRQKQERETMQAVYRKARRIAPRRPVTRSMGCTPMALHSSHRCFGELMVKVFRPSHGPRAYSIMSENELNSRFVGLSSFPTEV